MLIYLDIVILLNFVVDLLIILGTNRLTGYPLRTARSALSAAVGSIYAGMCMLPEFRFLAGTIWRIVSLVLMSSIAFGWNRSTIRRGIVFSLISMALGGFAMAIGNGGIIGILISAAAIYLMCSFGFGKRIGAAEHVPVDLHLEGNHTHLTALKDTGNTLTDPITGQSVLVVGPEIAWDILGLSQSELSDPISTFEKRKNSRLRLIPFRTVGQATGMLLAVRFDEVRISGEKTGQVVAFSPNSFGTGSAYQALTGGIT